MTHSSFFSRAFFFSIFCCSISHADSIDGMMQTVLQQAVNKNHAMETSNVGISITSMQTGQVLYQKNSDHLYTPASVQKLFTAAAALQYLRPSYQFQTTLYTTGSVHQGQLDGDVYVKFSGDPTLKIADLYQLIDQLQAKQISRINGHVYIDNFDYNDVPYPPGWLWDDLSYSYGAPMNAIILNRNKFALIFKPQGIGQKPVLSWNLPEGVISFSNKLKTTSSYNEDCPITIYSDMHNDYEVSGCFDSRSGTQARSLAVRDVVRYASVLMSNKLHDDHISFLGSVMRNPVPRQAVVTANHLSPTLSVILQHTIKKSDNLYINSIFKKLGQVYYAEPGSWQNGLNALKQILAPVTGIDFSKSLLTDGAGLSRYNLITPRQLTQLLYFIYHHDDVEQPLVNALPIAGKDGTLKWRMISQGQNIRVYAKTGSMTGVSALAGYVVTRSHGVVAFSVMANDFIGKRGPYTRLEDHICEALAQY